MVIEMHAVLFGQDNKPDQQCTVCSFVMHYTKQEHKNSEK